MSALLLDTEALIWWDANDARLGGHATVRTLPRHHADRFDRLIIAAAKVEGCTIVTSDEKFRMYDVPLQDARR